MSTTQKEVIMTSSNLHISSDLHNPLTGSQIKALEAKHTTITFVTQSGSLYTLISRPKIVVLVRDNTGEAWKGNLAQVNSDGGITLSGPNGGTRSTSAITSFYVVTS